MKDIFRLSYLLLIFILFGCGKTQTKETPLAVTPKYAGKIALKGVQQDVEVLFDNYGIPHIYAKNQEDAYFALGYLQAQERIAQMELLRRLFTGQLAEVLGDKFVASDITNKTVGVAENARQSAKALREGANTPFKKSMQAFLGGINTYLAGLTPATRPKDLLPTPKAYVLEDVFGLTAGFLYGFSAYEVLSDVLTDQLVNKLGDAKYLEDLSIQTGKPVNASFPAKNASATTTLNNPNKKNKAVDSQLLATAQKLTDHFSYGLKNSNGWALSGKITTTGKAYHLSDGHAKMGKPDLIYEAHLIYPGQDVYGLFVPMTTLMLIGHNRNIAWGTTAMLSDDTDLYREKVNPDNPDQVWENDRWVAMKKRKETLKILRNGKVIDSSFYVKSTRHGPVINDVDASINDKAPITLSYTGFKFNESWLQSFFNVMSATNLQTFKQAISTAIAPGTNIQYADKDNNIAWFAVSKLLKRPAHVNSKLILDGASGKDEPLGYYSFAQNPSSVNPPSGFVYSCNNQIGKVDGKLYPGYYVAGIRAKRLNKILSSGKKFSVEDVRKIMADDTSPFYKEVCQEVLKVLENEGVLSKSPQHKQVANLLKNWKGNHSVDAQEPIAFYQLLYQILVNTVKDEVGAKLFAALFSGTAPLYDVLDRSLERLLFNNSSVWYDDVTTNNLKETRKQIFAKSFDATVNALAKQNLFGKTWGELHTHVYVSLPALFTGQPDSVYNVGPFPFAGGLNVLNKTEFDLSQGANKGLYNVSKTEGAVNRNIVDFANIANSWGGIPTGQSGVPTSKFYSNQVLLYNSGKLRKMLMNRADIEQTSTRLVLVGHK